MTGRDRGRGVLLAIAAGVFAVAYGVLLLLSIGPRPLVVAAAVILGVPAVSTGTALLRRPERPLDALRIYVAELLDLTLELLTFPFIFVVVPLQALAGISLFVGLGLLVGLAACAAQNLLHLELGLMKSWTDIGWLALYTAGLFVVAIPGIWLSQVAEERSITVYAWLRQRAEAVHERVQARLR